MENAVDAIKMAGAILIFLMALTLAIVGVNSARRASDSVMAERSSTDAFYDTDDIHVLSNRIVGIETVIPTLYSYYKDNTTVLFYVGTGYNEETNTFGSIEPLVMYSTESLENRLVNSNIALKIGSVNSHSIYGLDNNDELTRQEPWSYNEVNNKRFVQDLVNGSETDTSNFGRKYYTSRKIGGWGNHSGTDSEGGYYYQLAFPYVYKIGGPLATNSSARFVERIGQYNFDATSTVDTTTATVEWEYNTTGATIDFDNGESIANERGNYKKVIQFIYIQK